jgi:2-hydroxy-3-keto-5-methylthiopentenyl-1-phosphate phosphatase
MNENDYLELVKQLKEKFDLVEKQELRLQELTKKICGIYGMARCLDQIISDRPEIVDFLISNIRSETSEILFVDLEKDEL